MISTKCRKDHGPLPAQRGRACGWAPTPTIVLLETGIDKTIRAADLHETDYTPLGGAQG